MAAKKAKKKKTGTAMASIERLARLREGYPVREGGKVTVVEPKKRLFSSLNAEQRKRQKAQQAKGAKPGEFPNKRKKAKVTKKPMGVGMSTTRKDRHGQERQLEPGLRKRR